MDNIPEQKNDNSAPETVQESAPVVTPKEVTPEAAKKSKKGLLVGCAVGAVALAGVGFGVTYAISNSPENVALSAVADFISSRTMAVNGTISLETKSSTSPVKDITLTLKSDQNSAKEVSTTAILKFSYSGKNLEITLGSVVIEDYTLYVRVDGLKDAIGELIKTTGGTVYEEAVELYEDLINNVIGQVEGNWWKISVPELIDEISELDTSSKKEIKEAYNCIVDVAKKATNKNDDYANIYKDNAFVVLKKYEGDMKVSGKGTAYTLSLDAEKLTSFANKMTDELDSLGLESCVEKLNNFDGVSANYTVEEVKKEDMEKITNNLPEIIVTVDSGLFSHTLTGVFMAIGDESTGYTGKVDLTFNKDIAKVAAPAEAKPVTELYDNISTAIEEWKSTSICKAIKTQSPAYYNTYCDSKTNKVKPEYKKMLEGSDL